MSRAEWWELLFFIKKLEPKQQQEVNILLQHSLDEQVRPSTPRRTWRTPTLTPTSLLQQVALDDLSLIALSVPGDAAKKLLGFLKQKLPSSCLSDLLCSHTYIKFYLRTGRNFEQGEELLGEDHRVES